MATTAKDENFDEPFEYPDVDPANSDKTDINPIGQPRYFWLARLIRYEDDAGGTFVAKDQANRYLPLGRDRPTFNLDDPNFNVSFGDLLLYVDYPNQRENQCMRNYEGRDKLVPTRMLMPLRFPFSLGGFPLRSEGVPIDIAFARRALSVGTNGSHDWDDMTPFHIQRKYDEDDNQNNVIDLWGKRWSGMSDSVLHRPFAIPWGVLVSRVDIEAYAEESERKTLDHVMNLPKFPRKDYRTNITIPQKGYPPQPFIFRSRFIENNPVLPLWPKETLRTGQQEVEYQQIHDATGARPRVNPPGAGCGPQTVQNLDPQSPKEIDRNKKAKKVKDDKAKAAAAEKAKAKADKEGKTTSKATPTSSQKGASAGSDGPDDDGGMEDAADEPMVEHEKWVPPEVDDDHFWPASDAYDDMGSDDEYPAPEVNNGGGGVSFIIKTDTKIDYAN